MLNDGGYNDTFKGLSNFLFYLVIFHRSKDKFKCVFSLNMVTSVVNKIHSF